MRGLIENRIFLKGNIMANENWLKELDGKRTEKGMVSAEGI